MSLYWILIIMAVAGTGGGIINFLMQADDQAAVNSGSNEAAIKVRPIWRSIIIGIGATLLVPFFLELAQSKLLDHTRVSWDMSVPVKPDTAKLEAKTIIDTAKAAKPAATIAKTKGVISEDTEEKPPIKDYLLLVAYCFLAAVSGPRFINNQVDGFLKDKQIKQLSKENVEVSTKNEKLSKEKDLENARNQILAAKDEDAALKNTAPVVATVIKPQIKQPTVANDPQKGRFGGKREVNNRKLCATVENAGTPLIYKVKIWVESTDPQMPINSDVVFYIHDTFRPSVITVAADKIKDGKIRLDTKLAWGAFTVGAVLDSGMTLLEYDLAEDTDFPADFRSR